MVEGESPGGGGIVGGEVMFSGDRQFDAFARQRQHPLLQRSVAVAGVVEGVDVRVATDVAIGGYDAPYCQLHPRRSRYRARVEKVSV